MAVLGEWLSTTLNCTMYTYEVAGMFLLMERAVLKRMREKVGWEDGAGDGMLCPGGSICNMQASSSSNCLHRSIFRTCSRTLAGKHHFRALTSFAGASNSASFRNDPSTSIESARYDSIISC